MTTKVYIKRTPRLVETETEVSEWHNGITIKIQEASYEKTLSLILSLMILLGAASRGNDAGGFSSINRLAAKTFRRATAAPADMARYIVRFSSPVKKSLDKTTEIVYNRGSHADNAFCRFRK